MSSKPNYEDFRVSVVLPSYNEKDNIVEAINRISKSCGKNLHEIIVVDDDSPDKTWEIVQEIKNPKINLIRRLNEKGLSSAIARGVKEAEGNIIVWLDCDLGIPPEEIPGLLEKLKESDVVIGSRYVKGGKETRPKWRATLSFLINLFASLMLGFDVRDYTSGFAAVKKEVFDKVKLSEKGFGEYFVKFLHDCKKNNFSISEVGYVYGRRKSGLSKSDGDLLVLIKYGFQYAWRIIKLKIVGNI